MRLAQRPNESTAWIPTSDATISKDHFAIVVDLATTHLSVYERGKQIEDFPAGVGTPNTPTPVGNFFVAMTVPAPSAGYGPFVLVTSAHSDAITDWDNSGDAIIAIHGPIDAASDALIGTTGAATSDGASACTTRTWPSSRTFRPARRWTSSPADLRAGLSRRRFDDLNIRRLDGQRASRYGHLPHHAHIRRRPDGGTDRTRAKARDRQRRAGRFRGWDADVRALVPLDE